VSTPTLAPPVEYTKADTIFLPRLDSPRKTIATAQNLYHRFHLFFSRKDFGYHVQSVSTIFFGIILTLAPLQDVTLAALYVSSKMQDTLKKPREILMASYTVRFPEQAAKSKSIVGEIDMDPAVRQETFSSTHY
jgi:CTD kinase subunit beta